LGLFIGQHGPQAAQGLRWNARPQQGDVTLQIPADELLLGIGQLLFLIAYATNTFFQSIAMRVPIVRSIVRNGGEKYVLYKGNKLPGTPILSKPARFLPSLGVPGMYVVNQPRN
jgi:hypothetical protein